MLFIVYLAGLLSHPHFVLLSSGSEEGAVFPPVPWGVSAPGRVCLYGGHVALPLRLHHHLHSAPQVQQKALNFNLSPLFPFMVYF